MARFDFMYYMCSYQLSHLLSNTQRTWAEELGWMIKVSKMRGQALLCFVIALVKCTKIYSAGANDALCLLANSKYCSWRVCSVLQFLSVDLPMARAFT